MNANYVVGGCTIADNVIRGIHEWIEACDSVDGVVEYWENFDYSQWEFNSDEEEAITKQLMSVAIEALRNSTSSEDWEDLDEMDTCKEAVEIMVDAVREEANRQK